MKWLYLGNVVQFCKSYPVIAVKPVLKVPTIGPPRLIRGEAALQRPMQQKSKLLPIPATICESLIITPLPLVYQKTLVSLVANLPARPTSELALASIQHGLQFKRLTHGISDSREGQVLPKARRGGLLSHSRRGVLEGSLFL